LRFGLPRGKSPNKFLSSSWSLFALSISRARSAMVYSKWSNLSSK
jgi:hypothetical protein